LNATDPSGQFIDWFMALPAAWQALVVAEIAVAARVLGIIDTVRVEATAGRER
jgi:hypothetical protein